jgi:hypothetical protein
MNNYYVYVLSRPWNLVPCYVGKGSGARMNVHERLAGRHPNARLAKIFVRAGGPLPKIKVAENLSEREAFIVEQELIAHFGRKILVNLTDGGDGVFMSPEIREKIRVTLSGRKLPEEVKQKISENHKSSDRVKKNIANLADASRGKKLTKEQAERLRQTRIGALHSETAKMKMSESQKRRFKTHPVSAETGAKISAANTGRKRSDETRKRLSDAAKAQWSRMRKELECRLAA